MNLILVAFVSVILATGVFNTEPKVSEGNKKTEVIVKDHLETKTNRRRGQSGSTGSGRSGS